MRKNVVLWTIVAIAVLARLPALLNDGLWRDEAYVYVDLIAPSFGEFLHRVTETEWHPPLFFLLDYAWTKLAGTSELALALLPFAFGVATVPVVYLLGRDADSREAGLVAAATYALAPMAIAYSNEYVYPLAGFTFALLAWRAVRARREPMTVAGFFALAAATLACVYSHYTALFVVPMLALLALTGRIDLRAKLAVAAAFVAGAVPFVLWLPVFFHQRHIGLPYEGGTSIGGKVSFFIAALLEFVPARPAVVEMVAVVLLLAAIVVVVRSGRMKPEVAALGSIFLLTLALTSADDLLAVRYVLACYGFLCVFLGSVLAQFVALIEIRAAFKPLAFLVTAALALIVAVGNVGYAWSNSSTPKSGMRSFTSARPLDARTLYVIAPDYMTSTFYFYARGAPVAFRGFVRNDRPEIFRLDDYVTDWNRPDAVDQAVAEIEAQASAYRCIDLLIDAYARDQAQIPYGKAWLLLRRLERRFHLVAHTLYPARYEPVDAYAFSTGAAGAGTSADICR